MSLGELKRIIITPIEDWSDDVLFDYLWDYGVGKNRIEAERLKRMKIAIINLLIK
jgi:3'-phosphoadenosine 5'-phosphosulfate sulfotransferase (PAPS reductase)/FAD synthetase